MKYSVLRRDVMKAGLSVFALSVLAACGSPAAAPTSAPSATSAPATQATQAPTEQPAATDTAATSATTAATTEPAATATAAANTSPASGSVAIFQIDSSQSQVSFTLKEVLMGKPNTVVGKTSKISGVISATLDNPANTKIGMIQIDATDLQTDSGMRNRMIQRFILQAQQAQYQYITFEPTTIEGLPAKVSAGTAIPVKITGNLKIRDVVKPVTFDATITMKSDSEVAGNAKATVTRSAFGLTIPSVPTVADVTDDVALALDFVATKQ